jgi:hypothetical protein
VRIVQPDADVELLYFGGNASRADDMVEYLGPLLAGLRTNLTMIDYRGYGRSSGVPTVTAMKTDALAAFDYLHEKSFDDIGRAVGFLQELAVCGEEQARTPMLVDLNTLVRDLEPVLKNVVGADVEVALRDTSTPLNVDVNTERIERLLVNLASYGRGRMPAGGRLRIELGTSVVDRHFSAKHPNVRLGLHALITVTESRSAAGQDDAQPQHHKRRASRPGVDFATLQGLVSECGGHLWMKVHPLGELVAKIRLPLVNPRDQRVPRTVTARAGRERQTARWFHS